MRDETYIESQRPRRMFAKILNDSRMFFAVARHAWDEAVCLIRESKEKEDRQPANEISMGDDVDSLSVRVESALTVAMMNYTTSIELLMKAFLGVRRRFNEKSLDEIRNKVRHESEKVLDHIPAGWVEELEGIYRAAEMAQIEIYPFYNDWNPPSGDWIEDTKRLDTNTFREFLHFLSKERLNVDRYSFEKFAGDDWRMKISSYDKIILFHEEVEKFLIKKAEEKGCLSTPITVTMEPTAEGENRFSKLSFPTPKAAFNFHQQTFGRRK